MRKVFKIFLLTEIVVFSFSASSFALANPLNLVSPANGASNIAVNAYFQWNSVPGAVKYILDISGFTQSEDNIPTSKCSGGMCSFAFLDLSIGSINYSDSYSWKITALNAADNPIDSSPFWTFTTRSPSNPPPPPPPGGGASSSPVDLPRPISAQNLDELFKAIINFFFILSLGIGPLMIVYAGFLILTAGGDAKKVTLARTIILWTLIALAIIFLAKGLTSLVKGALGG
ncbi:MAG: hypothetical protein Q7S70_00705 [bacterium]|nr:hypothetical protein [bacterium]